MGASGSAAASASVGAITVAGSYCAGSSAGLGLTGGRAVLPVSPVPSASTVNMTAPAAAARPIIFFGSLVVSSDEQTSALQSLIPHSYAVSCLTTKKPTTIYILTPI